MNRSTVPTSLVLLAVSTVAERIAGQTATHYVRRRAQMLALPPALRDALARQPLVVSHAVMHVAQNVQGAVQACVKVSAQERVLLAVTVLV